ncbi:MAG: PIN domain-containing protein [Methylococcales bacterium]
MKLLVSDANIFIDMDVAGIIRLMFQLQDEIAVPDILYEEELREHHPDLPGYGLRILPIKEKYMQEAYRLGDEYRATSHNDLLALSLAKQEACPLLSGDAALRKAANSENVEVKGSLWLMGKLLDEGLITVEKAEKAYAVMKKEGRRLPWVEVKKQISSYKT